LYYCVRSDVWLRRVDITNKEIDECCIIIVLVPLDIPLVVDISFLQPPLLATSGETASASQVLPKGPVVRACWCALGVNPGSAPVPTNGSIAKTGICVRECQGGSHRRHRFRSG
jgi:hypothetical protein